MTREGLTVLCSLVPLWTQQIPLVLIALADQWVLADLADHDHLGILVTLVDPAALSLLACLTTQECL